MRFSNYHTGNFFDEMIEASGEPRPAARALVQLLETMTDGELVRRQQSAERALLHMGITFNVYGDSAGTERIFPFDLIPRIVAAAEWTLIERGLKQRIPMPAGLAVNVRTAIAFAVWDGAAREVGARKRRSIWVPLSDSSAAPTRGAPPDRSRLLRTASLLEERLELRKRFAILGPSRGPLQGDENREGHYPAAPLLQIDRLRVRDERLESAATRHLAEQVQVAERGGQREVQSAMNRRLVQHERKSRRCASQVRLVVRQGAHEPGHVLRAAGVDDVEVKGRPEGAVNVGGYAANDHVVDCGVSEDSDERQKVWSHRELPAAARRRSIDRMNASNFSMRCCGVRRRFSRRSVRSTSFL